MARKSFAQKSKELLRKSPGNLDKMDRYRAFYLDQITLSPRELEQLDKYRKAFGLYCQHGSKGLTIAAMQKEIGVEENQCYLILREAIKLFGDVSKADKAGERIASREEYIRLAKAAEKAGEWDVAVKARIAADKLLGLFEKYDSEIDPKTLIPVTVINFNSSPETLKRQQQEDTIEIPYVDADEK